jgi:Domain of unknown function (DUF6285)
MSMQDRPTPEELLAAVQAFLRADVLPESGGRVRYHLLVALNLLEIVRRELALEPSHLRRERDGLRALGLAGPGAADDDAAVRHANERLSAAIRTGAYDADPARARLLAHLRAVLEDKLRVANPAFLERVTAQR